MKPINRRTVLRGIGATIALPWLEAMGSFRTENTPSGAPRRLAFMYIPNGVVGSKWFPDESGSKFSLPSSLQPLEAFKNDVTVISGLNRTYLAGEPHSQAGSCWMTSARPNERIDGITAIDTTLDQIIAKQIGDQTAFPSIELSCNSFSDNVEPKIFDAISWYGPGNDAKSLNDPHRVFKRLFGKSNPIKQSVLDTVLGEAKELEQLLGVNDRRKMEEYLTSVRAIENRLARQDESKGKIGPIDFALPDTLPSNRGDYIRMMGDLMVLAFQTDQTRIATMMVGPERWETPQLFDGVFDKPVGHHHMTHDPSLDDDVAKIDRFHVQQYAYLIEKMKSIPEGDSTLLDNCLFILGGGIGNGATHSYKQLPLVIAGSGGQSIETGRHLVASEGTPLANLWLSLAGVMGVELPRYADSTQALQLA